MESSLIERGRPSLAQALAASFPWGTLFANRLNFEGGYFVEEERLVAKYLKSPSRVLVIGSGNGREARPLCHGSHRIFCLDIGLMYLKSGRKLFAREGIGHIHFLNADMAHLPFAEESFDFVFFSLYSAAGEGRMEILRRIHRLMRAEGLLLLSCGTGRYPGVARDPVRRGISEQVAGESRACGFEMLESAVDPERPEYRFSMLRAR